MTAVNDQKWMQYAITLAERAASLGEVPVGAVIIDADENILGEGWNRPIKDHDPTAHAEIMALRAAGKKQKNYRLPSTTLYVTIEPCLMCAGAIIHARVDRLVFGAAEPKAGVVISQKKIFDDDTFNHRVLYEGGVLEESCSEIIRHFFQQRRTNKKQKARDIFAER
ncbi:MAG: tRNA adenosine(34) deaminase TadA [Cellvibrionaceae bacterium]